MKPSIWELESFYAPRDIIVIGSGLAGLWSAYYLAKANPKLRILVIDKGIIPTGASTRNAGFACYGSLTELVDDAKTMGESRMKAIVSLRYDGLKRIRKILGKKDIEYIRQGGYELISAREYSGKKELKKEIAWLNDILRCISGKPKVFQLADKKIASFGFQQVSHLVENKTEAQLHSGKMIEALLRLVQSLGVTVMNNVEAKKIYRIQNGLSVDTNLPVELKAEKILVCNNASAQELLPGIQIIPARGQVLLTSPIKKLPFRGTFHFDQGYYYFRDLGNKVLLGGARNKAFEDERTTDLDTTDRIQHELERFLREVVLPGQTFTIEQRWSGTMGMSTEKLPVVKKLQEGIYCAVGLGGMGVTLAPVIGEEIAAAMTKG